jgi:geranylgeranyl transferase type-2 subunit alpha
VRTEEQKQRDLERIAKYRDLEDQVRAHVARGDYSPAVFQLTTKLLRLNPEYYTIWNARRRCLISGSFSRPSAGSSCSTACSTSSPTATIAPSSTSCSSSSSATTPPAPGPPTAGKSGITADPADPPETTDSTSPTEAETQDLSIIKSELAFTIPLLLESPKCYWIWSYRLWILQQAIARLRPALARKIWEEELGLASKMLGKDRRNFHAWGYRRHVVAQLESSTLQGSSMVGAEFAYTDRMIKSDLSNFSAWHSRSRLIPRLLEERGANEGARRAFLDKGTSRPSCIRYPSI